MHRNACFSEYTPRSFSKNRPTQSSATAGAMCSTPKLSISFQMRHPIYPVRFLSASLQYSVDSDARRKFERFVISGRPRGSIRFEAANQPEEGDGSCYQQSNVSELRATNKDLVSAGGVQQQNDREYNDCVGKSITRLISDLNSLRSSLHFLIPYPSILRASFHFLTPEIEHLTLLGNLLT
jgi:hypothetical protein